MRDDEMRNKLEKLLDAFGYEIMICPKCNEPSLFWYEGYYSCAKCGLRLSRGK